MRKNAVIQALLAAGLIASTPLASAAGNLVFCSEGSPAGFDPGLYTTGTDFDAAAETVFNRLSQFERGGTKVIPGLAEKWDISDDGLSYTFHLRPEVKFHTTDYFTPSRDFNADDVLFTFQRMLDKEHPFRKAYPSEFPYFTDMGMDANIAKIEKLDDMTVKFSLNEVDAAFIQNLAMSFASIQSAEYADSLLKAGKAADINQKPIGTGPFVFSRYQKDAVIRFKGNKEYWQPDEVKIDNLIFAINTDASVRMQKLKAGECQVTLFPRPADLDALKKDPNLDMPEQAGFNVGYIALGVTLVGWAFAALWALCACGTSTHGTGTALGSFSAQVRGVRLVTPAGEIIDADAGHDSDVFRAAGTSLGALGILSRITLQNRERYLLHEREYVEDLASVLANIPRYAAENRHFEFWAFFESGSAIVKVLNETDREPTPPPRLQLPVSLVLELTSRIAHGIPGMAGAMQRLLTGLHSATDRVGRSYDIFPSERNARFNEMEYELPVEHGPECLREVIDTVRRARLRTLFPVEYRHVAADDVWLSPFQGRDTASISVHQHVSADHRPLFDLVEPIFRRYGGRPHWGKLHTLTARELAPLYPHWDDFQRVRERLDPQGRMLNDHLRRVLLA